MSSENWFTKSKLQRFQSLSATVLAPVRVAASWQMSNHATVAYQRFERPVNGLALRNLQLQSTQTVQMPRELRLTLHLTLRYRFQHGQQAAACSRSSYELEELRRTGQQ
ncbi:hypothetical protein AUC43_03875 [Hymenobacter sedentarius]|uniref:Outer membrane protein beta-barrel domain-containing protein n=1 Tax=Hymenobacter sedentarius TaxID=1411621 RepID=A0A0U3SDU7_9BACT|nr:hypothetical protein [Hymenobacter sedentarius]ALW84310.1 hypothetical protein AUC43_03875 [Hymenobacter sedentarius]